jgi:endonuclease/exonuclease/phosphatase (EEP) superfamily protein YafD
MRLRLLSVLPALLLCSAATPATPLPFKAMTYNVLYDSKEVEASIDAIEKELPDILCLTELTPEFIQAFVKRLDGKYPHRSFFPRSGTWGVGIASRHPLRNAQSFPQEPHRMPALEADVLLNGRRITVSCVHLMPPGAQHKKSDDLLTSMQKNAKLRARQAAALVERYSRARGPVLLLGDMNEGRRDAALKAFVEAGFLHACDGPGSSCGPTWPRATRSFGVGVEIDHVLGRGLTFAETKVLGAGGSDHCPVQARFDFAPPPKAPPSSPPGPAEH